MKSSIWQICFVCVGYVIHVNNFAPQSIRNYKEMELVVVVVVGEAGLIFALTTPSKTFIELQTSWMYF